MSELTIYTDEELAAVSRATWTPLVEVYQGEADRLDTWASVHPGPTAELARRRALQLRVRVPALCTLDDLSADVDDPDLEVDLDEEAAA